MPRCHFTMPILPRYEQYFADVTTSAKAFIELGLEQHRSVCINILDISIYDKYGWMDTGCRVEEGGFHLKFTFPASMVFLEVDIHLWVAVLDKYPT